MADPWELILHHSYSGTPGAVFDQSPRRASHGQVLGLHDSDFHTDGATSGSGAVSFESGTGRIFVPPSESWSPLQGFRIEVLLYRNTDSGSFDAVLESAPVSLAIRGDMTNAVVNTGSTHHILRYHQTPAQQWMTVGLTFDGVCLVELTLDGVVVSRVWQPLEQLNPFTGLIIGGDGGTLFLNGLIDDLKIWRLNPRRIPNEFVSRPMGPPVIDCWKQWRKGLEKALHDLDGENPECLEFILTRLRRAVYGGLGKAITHSDQSRSRIATATIEYREAWFSGNLAGIRPVLDDLIAGLESDGFDITQDPAYQELVNSDCWRRLVELTPPLDCDPDFTGIWG